MTKLEKYRKIFKNALNVTDEQIDSGALHYQSVPTWDSVGHMNMIAEMEEAFLIVMETIDVFGFSTYEKGIEILRDKYGVDL